MVPEFIQDAADPVKVANSAFDLLSLTDSKYRNMVLDGYTKLMPLLGKPGVSKRTAQYILDSLNSDR